MRRFILPIFASIAIIATSTACDAGRQNPSTGPSSAVVNTSSAAPAGDDKVACATAKSARDSVLNDLIMAFLTVGDEKSSAAEVSEAAKDLVNAYTVLADGMDKAAGQAATAALKDALKAYADGSREVLAKVKAAGTKRVQLDASTNAPDLDTAEETVMDICA